MTKVVKQSMLAPGENPRKEEGKTADQKESQTKGKI